VIQRCVAWCSRHSLAVIILAVALGIWGEHARRRLAADAVPDLSDPQVGLVSNGWAIPQARSRHG